MYFDSVLNLFTIMYYIPISVISLDGFVSFSASFLFEKSMFALKKKGNIYMTNTLLLPRVSSTACKTPRENLLVRRRRRTRVCICSGIVSRRCRAAIARVGSALSVLLD